jgi:hypothetical protein
VIHPIYIYIYIYFFFLLLKSYFYSLVLSESCVLCMFFPFMGYLVLEGNYFFFFC